MKRIDPFVNQVYCGDALHLLRGMPSHAVDAVLADPMYGVTKQPTTKSYYGWGPDPCRGDPDVWATIHLPIYRECRRVLKGGGKLAWTMGSKFRDRFADWFGGYRIWSLSRFEVGGRNASPFGHVWIVQSREQEPVRFPDADSFIVLQTSPKVLKCHPYPKAVEEMRFMVQHLSKPGGLILDLFCGIGTTLVAAQQLGRRYIGCDLWPEYCRVALQRLREVDP